nr:glutamyl-tRNA(Gln) amidotransferase subunit C, chloroplastic/mitochondrial [Ipomoea batatas]
MGSRTLLSLCLPIATGATLNQKRIVFRRQPFGLRQVACRSYSTKANTVLQPPDVSHLAETARISLTTAEVEEFALKIRQVIDWFGQLQVVDLQSIEPAIRADAEGDNLRDDFPEIFENREAMIAAVPSYEDPYIKVPKVLNKE